MERERIPNAQMSYKIRVSLDITYTADKMYHCYLGYMSLPFATLAKVFLTVHAIIILTQAGRARSAMGKTTLKFKNPFRK